MSDDIVTRLHNEADYWCYDTAVRIFREAADEIERLRAERLEWFMSARKFAIMVTDTNGDIDAALDQYLRSRGRLEDPRG